jgi:DNA-binding transcriptional regulator LsrR (DeoR family)
MPGESTVYDALPSRDRIAFAKRGAVAESAGMLFTADGKLLRDGLQHRVIAITEAQLRRTPDVVALASDEGRIEAVRAIARSGLITTLITHRAIAEELVRTSD